MVFLAGALWTATVRRIAVKNRVAELEISMRSAGVEADKIFEDEYIKSPKRHSDVGLRHDIKTFEEFSKHIRR